MDTGIIGFIISILKTFSIPVFVFVAVYTAVKNQSKENNRVKSVDNENVDKALLDDLMEYSARISGYTSAGETQQLNLLFYDEPIKKQMQEISEISRKQILEAYRASASLNSLQRQILIMQILKGLQGLRVRRETPTE